MLLDGAMGTELQARGLKAGVDPCDWNLENPSAIGEVHRAYLEAGSRIILTNTFGANRLKYHGTYALEEVIVGAVTIAKREAAAFAGARVALDIGPTGKLLKPTGDLDIEDAIAVFGETVRLGAAAGADLVFIETMSDSRELKAAVVAAKENSDLPVYATVALGEDGKLLTGADVEGIATMLEGLGVDAYGFNCGLGPDRMLPFVRRLAAISTRPIIVKANAGMPKCIDGRTVFAVGPVEFAADMKACAEAGATILGGCCGTTPAHIRGLA